MKKVLFFLMLLCMQHIFAQQQNALGDNEIGKKTALTDSVQHIREKADKCMMQLNYNLAASYYRKLLEINISDNYALRKLKEAEYAQKNNCKNDLTQAEKFFSEKSYTQAKPLYKKVVERGCDFATIANERLLQIKKILKSKNKDY